MTELEIIKIELNKILIEHEKIKKYYKLLLTRKKEIENNELQ